ncbi:MAG: sigma-54 dependent transcriptional regulator [Rhodobiaceae bacterium]|nr:sigma-54 dependent transcriptional regulator [Rhodobiaceae bacterium]
MSDQSPHNILIVEDTLSLATVYIERLASAGYACDHVETASDAISALSERSFSLVLLDLQLPDSNGMTVLEHVKRHNIDAAVVIITANGSINVAIDAMRLGAFDFLVKPFSKEKLLTTTSNALESVQLKIAVDELDEKLDRESYFGFIGSSPQMQGVYRTIDNVARSNATVFITGESGTGKEICAEAIHRRSQRHNKPFVPLNCGAIPKDLIESEIFGHLKGAFTGAIADRAGAAGQAHGGTLFLDEICEMDLTLQTKLLRFLQTNTIQRVGSNKIENVDVRVVCATNRDPAEEVRAGRFREDLYYRLFVIPIDLPPLRARGNDISELASHFLATYSREEKKKFEGFTDTALGALASYNWPGNVRELQNLVRNMVVLNDSDAVTLEMLPEAIRTGRSVPMTSLASPQPATAPTMAPSSAGTAAPTTGSPLAVTVLGKSLMRIERETIEKVIAHCGGSIPKAAKALDVSPSTIYRKREAWEKDDTETTEREISINAMDSRQA